MKLLLTALSIIIVSCGTTKAVKADYSYMELGVGYELTDGSWIGDVPASAEIGHHWDIQDNFYIRAGLNHTSNLDKGAPLNNDFESQINWLYLKAGFKF